MNRVFVSTPLDGNLLPWQQKLKGRVLDLMIDAGLDPQLFGVRGIPLKESWTFDRAAQLMDDCSAAAIIAFARYRFPDSAFSSEYNHFEGALAIARKLPM